MNADSTMKKAYKSEVTLDDAHRYPRIDDDNTIVVVVIGDGKRHLQTIFRKVDLLDVDMVDSTYGSEFRAMSQKKNQLMLKKLNIEFPQPLPLHSKSWTTVIDTRVTKLDHVDIPIESKTMIRLSHDEFMRVFRKADVEDIAKQNPATMSESSSRTVEESILEFTKLKIRRRLDETIELPPLSNSARYLMQLRTNPTASVDDLVEIIERDPSLTANILRWAKSSFYGQAKNVADLKDAIGRIMGFDLVMNLAMGLTLTGAIKVPDDRPDGFMEYWSQAIWMSNLAVAVSQSLPSSERPPTGTIYLVGMLHNFGYLILGHVFPSYFKLLCRHWETNRHHDPYAVEQLILGISREEITTQLFRCWEMPEEITTAIEHQKNDDYEGPHRTPVRILQACRSLLVESLDLELGYDVPPADKYLSLLNVDQEKLDKQLDQLKERREHIESLAALI